MQYERIEINYKDIDLGDSSLNINIKSNILKKVSDYSCSYSYTYDVPLTIRNKSILGNLLTFGAKNKKVRQFLPATYYRDGLKIFEGQCYVSEVGLDTVSLVFLFGINNALQSLKSDDVTIDKLWNDEDHDFHSKSESTGINIDYVTRKLPLEDYNDVLKFADMPSADENTLTCPAIALRNTYGELDDTWQYWPYQKRIPYAMRVKSILEQMNKRYGLSTSNLLEDGGRYLDDYLYFKTNMRRRGTFRLSTGTAEYVGREGGGGYFRTRFYKTDGALTSDTMVLQDADGNYPDVDDWGSDTQIGFYSKVVVDMVHITWSFKDIAKVQYTGNFQYHLTNGSNYVLGEWESEPDGEGTIHTISIDLLENNIPNSIDVGDMSDVRIVTDRSIETHQQYLIGSFIVTYDCHFEEDNAEQGLFNIFDTLPSVNAVTFLSDYAFTVYGKFPINTMKGGNTLTFTSLEEIAQNTPYDWSDKLQNKDLKVYHSMDGLARKNWLKYADDESETCYDVSHAFDYSFDVEDETIDDEEDYFETITSYALPHGDNEAWFLERREDTEEDLNPQPRYMRLTRLQYLLFKDVNYAQMKNSITIFTDMENHMVTINTLSDPMRIECKIKLNTIDLATLDVSRPVYLGQFGAVFFIDELKVGSNDIATAKLTRLKI